MMRLLHALQEHGSNGSYDAGGGGRKTAGDAQGGSQGVVPGEKI